MKTTTATIQDFEENTQEVYVQYELDQDFHDPEIFYITYAEVLSKVMILPSDIKTDLEEAIMCNSGKRYVKWRCEVVYEMETVNVAI